jgi:hypothetical protein
MVRADWDLARFTDDNGRLGKAVPPGNINVPGRVWLDGGVLKYELWPKGGPYTDTVHKPRKQLLNDFVKLWRASDARILAFAKQNGMLWRDGVEPEGEEPIADWRRLSRVTCAFLNIAAELKSKKKDIDSGEWRYILAKPDSEQWKIWNVTPERAEQMLEEQLKALRSPEPARVLLPTYINQFLPPVTLRLAELSAGFSLEIDYQGKMTHAMALQLAATICGSDIYICSGCSFPYTRPDKRKPNPGDANFCDDCGRDAALQRADARRRAKMADARRLHAEGLPLKEIAQRIDANVASVRRWIKKGK